MIYCNFRESKASKIKSNPIFEYKKKEKVFFVRYRYFAKQKQTHELFYRIEHQEQFLLIFFNFFLFVRHQKTRHLVA